MKEIVKIDLQVYYSVDWFRVCLFYVPDDVFCFNGYDFTVLFLIYSNFFYCSDFFLWINSYNLVDLLCCFQCNLCDSCKVNYLIFCLKDFSLECFYFYNIVKRYDHFLEDFDAFRINCYLNVFNDCEFRIFWKVCVDTDSDDVKNLVSSYFTVLVLWCVSNCILYFF